MECSPGIESSPSSPCKPRNISTLKVLQNLKCPICICISFIFSFLLCFGSYLCWSVNVVVSEKAREAKSRGLGESLEGLDLKWSRVASKERREGKR